MWHIRGENPETVYLPELKDFIYYKQEKIFSDSEYFKSITLQQAINKGSVLVLEHKDERDANFNAPKVTTPVDNKNSADVSLLFDYLKNLESKIDGLKTSDGSTFLIDQLMKKIDVLEKKLQEVTPQEDSGLKDTLKKFEEVMNKFTGIATKSDEEKKEIVEEVPEEIYVPNVRVEDGKSHINLKVRTIENTNNINTAAEALKKFKKST